MEQDVYLCTCDWSPAMDDYELFRRNRQGRRVGGMVLLSLGLDIIKLNMGKDQGEG